MAAAISPPAMRRKFINDVPVDGFHYYAGPVVQPLLCPGT
jgi:hypothetical protein